MSRPIKIIISVVIGAVVLVVGGTWLYINVIDDDAPEKFSLKPDQKASSSGDADASIDGTWTVGAGSEAGYRVDEILFGQNNTAAGRTTDVTGTVTLEGTKVTATTITVDLTTVSSDEERRDNQFQGRIMNTAEFPTATFELTEPADFGEVPAEGAVINVKATGKLTMHGTTRTVAVDLQAKRSAGTIEVTGNLPIVFADYGIPNPSFGPISTEDHGELEFLLKLTKS